MEKSKLAILLVIMTSSLNCFILNAYDAVQILERVSSDIRNTDTSTATSDANAPKNRYKDKIPCKRNKFIKKYFY